MLRRLGAGEPDGLSKVKSTMSIADGRGALTACCSRTQLLVAKLRSLAVFDDDDDDNDQVGDGPRSNIGAFGICCEVDGCGLAGRGVGAGGRCR